MSGYLEIIFGPMFSGKTTRLIEVYNEYKKTGKNVLVINYDADRRYHDSMLSTHDRVMIPCTFTDNLSDITGSSATDYADADVILINEGQFFADLYSSVIHMVEISKKRVHVCGLDGDFRREKFGQLLDLIPICDNVVKLKSSCHNCKESALFSHRMCNSQDKVLIGSDIYIPLCRHCYTESALLYGSVQCDTDRQNTFTK